MCFRRTARCRSRPSPDKCPRTHGTAAATIDCDVPVKQLVWLDTRTAPVVSLDLSSKQDRHYNRFLDLPLDILEQIFGYLLVAPSEIYFGVVTLERQLPHHWHPADSLRRAEPSDNWRWEDGLGRTPVVRHRRTQTPFGLCHSLLLVNRQFHIEAARVLYGRNVFAIDIGVPTTQETAQHYDISRLRLEQLIPLNPVYHQLLRHVNFRHYNKWMCTYPVRFFHAAMMHVLCDMPSAFTAFRRRYDAQHGGFDVETFAGWSPSATPTWFNDASTSLATSEPLTTTNLSMHLNEVHWLMNELWQKPLSDHSDTAKTREERPCIDLSIMSDPTVFARPWDPDNPQSRHAARIFLVRLRNDYAEHPWPPARAQKRYSGRWHSHFQTPITGYSRGLHTAHTRKQKRYVGSTPHRVWLDGPKGKKRRVFTAPLSFILLPICQFLREKQLEHEDRRWYDDHVDVPILPIDDEVEKRPWHYGEVIESKPRRYEYV